MRKNNNNTKIKSSIKRINRVEREIKRTGKRVKQLKLTNTGGSSNNTNYVEPTRIANFRKYKGGDLLSEMQIYYKHVRDRYLLGLIHPDIAVKEQIPVKMYSDVPIPTASMGFHEQYNFSTNANGCFLLSWTPNFLVSQPYLTANGLTQYSCLTFNNSASLTGSAVAAGNVYTLGAYIPNVDFQKYRLVSAMIKVQYNGAILDQAGTMFSCAAYDGFPVAVGNGVTQVTTLSNTLADRYGAFSLIQNGLWNETTDISSNSAGLECLWLPTDPDSMIFDRTGAYKGQRSIVPALIPASDEGAYINYIVAGSNLPINARCILVDVYYNYEVIADPSAAPFLRSSVDTVYDSNQAGEIKNVLTNAVRSGTLIKKISKNEGSFMDKLGAIAVKGLEYLPAILSAVM